MIYKKLKGLKCSYCGEDRDWDSGGVVHGYSNDLLVVRCSCCRGWYAYNRKNGHSIRIIDPFFADKAWWKEEDFQKWINEEGLDIHKEPFLSE